MTNILLIKNKNKYFVSDFYFPYIFVIMKKIKKKAGEKNENWNFGNAPGGQNYPI